ncbi:type-F conjugative transfer system pilin acetylase TraX [Escherichia coli]|nr:type-F conjugative transfer system pilin acetylase TraX [Escherichia coli]EFD0804130.1 type-F conjugative transfer system pilin acetylase TraX [Escherichia coli]
MMSIAQVRSAGSAGNYYTDKDNYYVLGSMGERWAGKGAEQLGLQGSVDKDVFTRLLEGRLPDGADLSRMQDGSNKHRPGYDLTFSAPKSVSMMAMLGGDKRLIDAHNQAVDFAVRQVEALASTRVMTDGQSETVLTGNLVMALFNHDTSRDQEPQLHTHAVVANVTQHNGEWKTLSSDKVGKTGFIENVYANQIAFGRLYREKLKEQVEALGYETEVVGKHGMWEMPGVPVEAFSGRSQAIREAVGEDASLKSRDVAALDTRKSKQHVDPEIRMAEWMQTLKETGFDIRAYRDAADQRTEIRTQAPGPASQDGPDVQQAVTQAIAGLSERKVQFTYTDVLARTVGILPPENGVIERARAGIDEAISREQLIPLDREKGLFTSGIHVLDELSVRALSRDIMKQNRVTVHPEKSVPRTAGYSDAVSVLAQDRPSLAIVSGQGGAAGQRERVAELVMMAREQGREVQIIAADRRSQMNLKQDERLSGELITGRRQLLEGMAFTPGSTVIVDQGEKLSLKETLTLLDGAARHNVQVLIPGQRDIIKTVALVLMVLDHINLIFQLKQEWMFLAGRGAFPLFALVWGLNLSRHAHIRQPAINRLWGWGIIAQFAYYLAGFPWYEGNILFAFAVAAQVLTWCETRSGWRTAAAILLMALWGPLSGTSYGIAGLLMLAVSHRLYRAEDRAERLALVACLLAVIPALNLATSDAAAVAGLVMTVLTVGLVSCAGKSLPRFWPGDFFPVFYACHLAVLGVLAL